MALKISILTDENQSKNTHVDIFKVYFPDLNSLQCVFCIKYLIYYMLLRFISKLWYVL